MKKLKKIILVIVSIILNIDCLSKNIKRHFIPKLSAVTYTMSGGQFGDNLIAYMHAKWISYKYNIPLLYKPFNYSDQLVLHRKEPSFAHYSNNFRNIVILNDCETPIEQESNTLYVVPYFPESKQEYEKRPEFRSVYFSVDWTDEKFQEILRNFISPVISTPKIEIPNNKISVAVHVRKPILGHDFPCLEFVTRTAFDQSWENVNVQFPFKFLSDDFFISKIKQLNEMIGYAPLYIFIFTNDPNPMLLVEKYKEAVNSSNIEWDYRKCPAGVLNDFFALGQFEYLIRSDSNFSIAAEKIGKCKMSLYPTYYFFDQFDHMVIQ